MTKNKQLILIALLVLLFFGCKKDNLKIYDRPSWLAGKLYAQILTKPELSTFADLIKISGYDTIINVSGSFTVFAPSNDAFTQYFQSNPKYKKVTDIPKAEVVKLVKYHIVQDGWTKKQLMSLDVNGWIDSLDLKNNLPRGYKRQTLLMEKNRKYGVRLSKYLAQNQDQIGGSKKRHDIIDTTATTWYRRVITDSRKYAPIFYQKYFNIYNLVPSDFTFYFGRPFLSSDIYYCGARITSNELFAENGVVYVIDQVVEPLKNGVEFLTDNSKNNYSTFYNLLNLFSEFTENPDATSKQPGYAQGFKVDTLYNLTYPKLVFDINSELTKAPRGTYGLPGNVSIRYHQGIVAPTNEAMDQLVSEYLAGGNNWGSIDNAPENIKRIIVNSCLSINPVYPTDVQRQTILNGESDNIVIDESSIVQKEYGSSCTFIGVNKPVVPRAFSSVTGPIYLRKGFSKVMYAIEAAGLLPALKKKGVNYSVYVESDNSTSIDSTLLIIDALMGQKIFFLSTMKGPDGKQGSAKPYQLFPSDLRTLLLNHVATDQPKGSARKEFIKNLAGNYLIFDNVTHVVQGTSPSTFGYNGSKYVYNIPRKISTNSDNGSTYEIDSWFNFSITSVYNTLSTQFRNFHALIKKAGLSKDVLSTYSFMSPTVNYTVFAPSDSLLNTMTMTTNAMSTAELKNFVMMHFIQGDIIFTDGNMPSKYYETCRIDEKSTPFLNVFTKIKIVTGTDKITIASVDGSKDVLVNESPMTNFIMSRSLSTGSNTTTTPIYPNSVTNGVVHEIKKPLLFGQVDAQ